MPRISVGFVKRKAKLVGADLVGIASIDRFKHYPEERQPEHLFPDAKSVIVVGVRVLLDTVKPNHLLSALHHITLNMYHNQIAYDIGRLLDDKGYSAVVIPHRIGNLDPDLRKSGDYMNIYLSYSAYQRGMRLLKPGLASLAKAGCS